MKKENYFKEFFDELVEKLENIFPKGEKCRYCGKKDWGRSKALLFNAYANMIFRKYIQKALKSEKEVWKKKK